MAPAGTDGAPAPSATALGVRPWADIARSWPRRDSAAFRAHMEQLLRTPGSDDDGALRVWRRFSQAVFAGELRPLLTMLAAEAAADDPLAAEPGWDEVAERTVDRIAARVPDGPDRAVALATLSVFFYFESLTFWENGQVYEELHALRRACRRLHEAHPPAEGDSHEAVAHAVRDAVDALFDSLEPQFGVENAIGSCCPRELAGQSRAAERQLGIAWSRLDDAAADLAGRPASPSTDAWRALVELLARDIEETRPYHALLASHVAPASERFVENLVRRDADGAVIAELEAAIEACSAFEQSEAGLRSVSSSETRAHRYVLGEARDQLVAGTPTVLFDEAEVVFSYPFGLPVESTGDDPVRRTLRAYLEGDAAPPVDRLPLLAGASVTLEDTPQTDAWVEGPGVDGLDYIGVRLVFERDELLLRTASGVLHRDLGIEVRLGGLGNHYVRITAGTHTQVWDDELGTWTDQDHPWTPHDLDQFVRGSNRDTGAEELWFRPLDDPGDPLVPPAGTTVHGSLLELAARLVADIAAFAEELAGAGAERDLADHQHLVEPGPDDARPASDEVVTAFLERHAQVLVTVTRATLVGPGTGPRAIESAVSFETALGSRVALTAQRPFAQSILEWLRYPEPTAEERRERLLDGRIRRELLWCSGDVTLVYAPSLPNWQLMETREVIEFAASLTGVYSRRHAWLHRRLAIADRRSRDPLAPAPADGVDPDEGSSPPTGTATSTKRVRRDLDAARAVELDLDECLNHIQVLLDRARNFRMSRDLQSRDIVRHVCGLNGVVDLQDALGASVAAADTQQRLVHARVERLQSTLDQRLAAEADERRKRAERPLQYLISALTVFAFIDLFWWTNDSWQWTANHAVWAGQLVFLAVLGGVVLAYNIRSARRP